MTAEAARRGVRGIDAALALVVFLVALAPRIGDLDVVITPDETRWICRSTNFYSALASGDLARTYQKEHPGVVTMWLGNLGRAIDPTDDVAVACRDIAPSRLVGQASHPTLLELTRRLFAGRIWVALATAAGIAAMYLLATPLVGRGAALLAGLLIAWDPLYIGQSRVLHLDALTTTLMTLSLLALLEHLRRSGALGGAGAAGESPSGTVGVAAAGESRSGTVEVADAGESRSGTVGVADAGESRPGTVAVAARAPGRGSRRAAAWWRTAWSVRMLALSGVLGGIAALNKSPAMFLAPFVLLVALALGWRRADRRRWIARIVLVWGVTALFAYVALWPAMWVTPVDAVVGVLRGALGYAEEGHEGSNYFWGAIRPDPGPFFYPVAWLLRATGPVLLGLVACAVALTRRGGDRPDRTARTVVWVLAAYAVLFALFMTTGAKKFDRYLLPVFPAVILIASVGLAGLVSWAARRFDARARPPGSDVVRPGSDGVRPGTGEVRLGPGAGRRGPNARWRGHGAGLVWPAALALTLVAQGALVLPHHPYYLSYYNPLLGGARAGQWALLVGWGEGLDQAVAYLNARPNADTLTVATRYRSSVGPELAGRALEMDDYDPASLDYYLFYVNQIQRDLDPALIDRLFGPATPELKVSSRGIDYAWLYANDNYVPAVAHIASRSRVGDAVVARADSQLARHYEDAGSALGPDGLDLPLYTFGPDDQADDILAVLQAALSGHPRVWYVRYDDVYPRPGLAAADFAIATKVFTASEKRFPELAVRLLEAEGPVDFTDRPTVQPMDVTFGDALRLSGYGLTGVPLRWGRDLGVALDWEAVGDLDRNLTAFLHLYGPDGRRVAQVDQRIADIDLVPTADWAPGARARDRYHLALPPGAPPGRYELQIGVYDSDTTERLPVVAAGRALDGPLTVDIEAERRPATPEFDDLDLVARAEAGVGEGLELVGYALEGAAEGGARVPVVLYWVAREPLPADLRVRLEAFDSAGATVGEAVFAPGGVSYATGEWDVGNLVRGVADLPLDPRARAGTGHLELSLAPAADEAGTGTTDEAGTGPAIQAPLASMTVTVPFQITGPPRAFDVPTRLDRRVWADLGDRVTLVGYDLGRRSVAPGETIPLTVTWRADTLLDVPYTVFVHLIDGAGVIRAQVDAQPLGGRRPTTSWLTGEVVADPYTLVVPADAPPGRYTLAAGMYDGRGTAPMPLAATDAEGRPLPDHRVPLGAVDVAR